MAPEKVSRTVAAVRGRTQDRVMSLAGMAGICGLIGIGSLVSPLAGTVKIAGSVAGFTGAGMALTGAVALGIIGRQSEQIERMREQLELLSRELQQWKEAGAVHEKKRSDLEARIKIYEENQDDAAMEIPEVAERFEQLRERLETAEAAEAESAEIITEYEQRLTALESKLESFEQRALTAEADAQAKGAELLKLEREHERLVMEFQNHKQHFAEKLELEITRQTADRISTAVVQQTLELRERVGELEGELDEADEQIDTLIDALKGHEPQLNALQQQAQELLAEKQATIRNLDAQVQFLQQPRKSGGLTLVDQAADRVTDFFGEKGLILDFHHTELNPSGGYTIFWDLKRNPGNVNVAEEVFDRHVTDIGLMNLSERKLDFVIDPRNGLLTLRVHMHKELLPPRTEDLSGAVLGTSPTVTAKARKPRTPEQAKWDAQLKSAGCFVAAEFDAMVDELIADRVRVCAGSEGGKTPLMESFAIAITNKHQGKLAMLNPLPGSPKDYLVVPSVPTIGDPFESNLGTLGSLHRELNHRYENLEAAQTDRFVMVAVDELPKMARKASEIEAPLGAWLKDFYQISSHANMGIVTSAQGTLVSGVKGGKGDVTATLRTEDFDNASQVFLGDAIRTAITKMKGSQRAEYLEHFEKLQAIADKANAALGLRTVPKRGDKQKRVDVDAYRIAFVLPTGGKKPFFFQVPAYGSLRLSEACEVPAGSKITSPHRNADGSLKSAQQALTCPSCGGSDIGANSPTAKRPYRWCNNASCDLHKKKRSPSFFESLQEAIAQ